MNDSLEDILLDLVRTYSPTGKESEAIEKFCTYLEGMQASDVHKDAAGNALGTFPGSGISVALLGHIDTVPGELPVSHSDDKLCGRGAVDAKSSLIALLSGAKLAKNRGFKGSISVIATVGEEGSGGGILEIASKHQKTDYAVLGEPSGTTGITTGYRGRLLIDGRFESVPSHASAPWMGRNAIDMAIETWVELKHKYGAEKEFSKVSVALTSIRGGVGDNVIPSNTSVTLDVRYPPSRRREELLEEFTKIFTAENGGGHADLKVRSEVHPYVSGMKTHLVHAFKDSIRESSGENPKMIFKSGSGDMNILGSKWDIPCITYGPGNSQLSHTDREVISLSDVKKSAQIVADALIRLERLNASN